MDRTLLDDLCRLSSVLSFAVEEINKNLNCKFYIVIVREIGKPEIIESQNIEECKQIILDLQNEQLKNPDIPIYVYIFEGVRWQISKSPKGLVCGGRIVPLSSDTKGFDSKNVDSLLQLIESH